MPVSLLSVLLGAISAGAVAWLASRSRLLDISGSLAALIVGTIVFGVGGLPFSVPLLVFFGSSSVLTRVGIRRKESGNRRTDKPGPRDAWQVLANGGVATVIVLLAAILPASATPSSRDWYLLYLSALAAVNADTWATEIGSLSRNRPRLITTLRPVPVGTNGGISFAGTAGALIGAAVIVMSAAIAWPTQSEYLLWRIDLAEALAVTWAGFMASLVDSLIGATVQRQYHCPRCNIITETRMHCGAETVAARGWPWVNNDVVNAAASLAGVVLGWYLLVGFAWPLE